MNSVSPLLTGNLKMGTLANRVDTDEMQDATFHHNLHCFAKIKTIFGEHSGSVVECLTQDPRATGSSLTGVTLLWSLSKTHLS